MAHQFTTAQPLLKSAKPLLTISALAVLASLALLAPAAPIPEDAKPVLYFPTTIGAKWVYADGDAEETLVVTKVEADGDAHVVTVMTADKKPALYERVRVSAAGLARLEMWGPRKLDPPQDLLRLAAKPGDQWPFRTPWVEGTNKLSAVETIQVPAGSFEAARVDSAYTDTRVKRAATFWYAKGVGLLRVDYGPGRSRVLKSFAPGK